MQYLIHSFSVPTQQMRLERVNNAWLKFQLSTARSLKLNFHTSNLNLSAILHLYSIRLLRHYRQEIEQIRAYVFLFNVFKRFLYFPHVFLTFLKKFLTFLHLCGWQSCDSLASCLAHSVVCSLYVSIVFFCLQTVLDVYLKPQTYEQLT